MSKGFRVMDVCAAGGLVMDNEWRCLMILRDGVWDLPKGHREEGEEILAAALREVEEETGVRCLPQADPICVTSHYYFRDGAWYRKFTHWYLMHPAGDCATTPQTDEGIAEVRWIPAGETGPYLEQSFSNIREVFSNAGIMKLL